MRSGIIRACVLGLVVAALALPPGDLLALARQQKPPQPPPQEQKKEGPPDQYTLTVEVPLVNVEVVVTDNHGSFLTGLKKENFRILEDGAPQQITSFAPAEAPITIVLLIEFSKLWYSIFADYTTYMGEYFLRHLKPEDWVALVSFDLKTRIEVDFTRNKNEVSQTLRGMYFPAFREANLFDALLETLDRLQDVKGKKSILVLASGLDTFSKHTLDDTLKRLRQSDVTIFTVGVGQEYLEWLERRSADPRASIWLGVERISYLQAENQMRAFAEKTGGRAWFPRFQGEWNDIFSDVAASLRNQYSLGYVPANKTRDGKFRKIKVELVGADGKPLIVQDQKGKKVKFVVYAREGYLAPKGAISD